MPDLNPCPFCRGKARWDMKNKAPQCSKCLATIPSGGGIFRKLFDEGGYRAYMAALWNRRDWDSEPDDAMVCMRTKDGFWRSGNDFCSFGKRKDGAK